MAGTSGDNGQPNVHAAWRLAQAATAVRAYQANPKLAALAVAGSVGSGLAGQFSDLELDCYWFSAPGDPDRTGPVNVLGGQLTALWDYDQDDEEWSEDYRLLAEARTGADLGSFREELSGRRRAIGPPPG